MPRTTLWQKGISITNLYTSCSVKEGAFGRKPLTLDVISVPPRSDRPSRRLMVLLHGWGANYYDLVDLSTYLDLPEYQFLCPNAPFPHPYSPSGRMWYGLPADMNFMKLSQLSDRPDREEAQQLQFSRQQLIDWLHSLEAETDVPLSSTVLAGFSQGGAMALDVGSQIPLAAVMVLSGYLHAPLTQPPACPVLLVHGRQDPVVPILAAYQARDRLLQQGVSVTYHELDMGHEIQPIVLKFMQSFISEQVFPIGESPERA